MPWPWQKDGLLPLNRRWQTLRARAPKATLRVGVGALILAFALVLVLSKPLPFVVDTTDYAIVTAFGKPTQVITSPGLGFRGAYESLRTLDRRLFVYVSPPAEFLTLEKTQVIAAGTVLWRVADPRKFFETVFDRTGAESRLGDVLFAELGAAIGRNPLTGFVSIEPRTYRADEIVAETRSAMSRDRRARLRHRGRRRSAAQLRFSQAEPGAPVCQNELGARAHQHAVSVGRRGGRPQDTGHCRGGEGPSARPSDSNCRRRGAAKEMPRRRASMRARSARRPISTDFCARWRRRAISRASGQPWCCRPTRRCSACSPTATTSTAVPPGATPQPRASRPRGSSRHRHNGGSAHEVNRRREKAIKVSALE